MKIKLTIYNEVYNEYFILEFRFSNSMVTAFEIGFLPRDSNSFSCVFNKCTKLKYD
jgi:hypothetical protein